ncbi:MAG TPA: LysM peptidoglycan-binding domain-containing protein, partial [Anaerolineales bacterium]|nr:LysM peptidoglycan-binding domain-containing protein [Anaerolineales bacterium]
MKPQRLIYSTITSICLFTTSCVNNTETRQDATPTLAPPQVSITITTAEPNVLPQPTRKTITQSITPTTEVYTPDTYYLYSAQNGDTLPTIARRFVVDLELLWRANLNLSRTDFLDRNTLVTVPDLDLSNSIDPFWIIPDSEVVYGPGQVNLDVEKEVKAYPDGWLWQIEAGNDYLLPGWRVVKDTAIAYSVNPRILLALIEYQSGLVT